MADIKNEHKVFAHEYVIDWNGTRAYQVAYPKCSYDTARVNASKLLTNTNINAYIEHIQKDLSKLAGISALSNINTLMDILNDSDGVRPTDRIKAIEVVNKMVGYNAPEKTEITLETLTDEERIRRIAALKGKMYKDK